MMSWGWGRLISILAVPLAFSTLLATGRLRLSLPAGAPSLYLQRTDDSPSHGPDAGPRDQADAGGRREAVRLPVAGQRRRRSRGGAVGGAEADARARRRP